MLTLALLIISGLLYEKYSKKNPGLTEITIEKANVVLDMNSGEWHELTKEQRESDISYSKTFRTIEYTVKKHLEADLFIHRIGNESKISPDLEVPGNETKPNWKNITDNTQKCLDLKNYREYYFNIEDKPIRSSFNLEYKITYHNSHNNPVIIRHMRYNTRWKILT
jgi:hypothetical protein